MNLFYKRRHPKSTDKQKGQALYLNNFGYYKDIEKEIKIERAEGRYDYQLIYVSSGEMLVGKRTLKSGDYCIFAPSDPQFYTYLPVDGSRYYWIHFTCNKADELLNSEMLFSGVHSAEIRQNELDTLFHSLSLSARRTGEADSRYEQAPLYSILLLLSETEKNAFPFLRAKKQLEDAKSEKTVSELAELYGMTAEHFIRSFKIAYGRTPQNYRIHYQLLQARNLLSDTRLSVLNIAEICGYTDQYYFSRLFKKHTGMTPTEYRKRYSI